MSFSAGTLHLLLPSTLYHQPCLCVSTVCFYFLFLLFASFLVRDIVESRVDTVYRTKRFVVSGVPLEERTVMGLNVTLRPASPSCQVEASLIFILFHVYFRISPRGAVQYVYVCEHFSCLSVSPRRRRCRRLHTDTHSGLHKPGTINNTLNDRNIVFVLKNTE